MLNLLKTEKDLSLFQGNMKAENDHYIEFETLKNYPDNGILIVAEHARTASIKSPRHGGRAYIGIGDANTATLAKLGAWYTQSAYIIPTLLRTQIDLSRPADAQNLVLRVAPSEADEKWKGEELDVPISTGRNLRHVFDFYHRKIEDLNPKFVLAYHGMHSRHKTDVLLGFGPGRCYIGGNKNAFAFRKLFVERLRQRLKERNVRIDITVKISKKIFTGTKNYTLYRHVKEYNDTHDVKRFGVHAEFNRSGRVMKEHPDLPKLRYQVAAQVLAECAGEWAGKQ